MSQLDRIFQDVEVQHYRSRDRVFIKYEDGKVKYRYIRRIVKRRVSKSSSLGAVILFILMIIFMIIKYKSLDPEYRVPSSSFYMVILGAALIVYFKLKSIFKKEPEKESLNDWIELTKFEYDHIRSCPAESKCKQCGGIYVSGSTDTCPHCGAILKSNYI